MKITFESENKKLLSHLGELEKKLAPAANVSALNSTGGKVRQWSVRDASKELGIPAKILRRRIAIPRGGRATRRKEYVILFGGLWVVPVDKLTPKPRELKSGAVKYKTVPGTPVDPAAFMANDKNGRRRVFARDGRTRLHIHRITVDIAPAVKRSMVRNLKSRQAQKYYEKIYFSQMDRRIRGSLRRNGIDT